MKTTVIAFTLCAALLTLSVSVSAHHSFQAEYDQNQPLKLVGKITKVLQENPHGWIYLDAPNAQGKIVNWALEIPNPFVVQQNGFNRDIYEQLMKSGEVVTVTAYAAKDGSKHAWAGGLTRADGKTVITLSGIPGQGGPRAGRGQQ
jgi:hypothetical protein